MSFCFFAISLRVNFYKICQFVFKVHDVTVFNSWVYHVFLINSFIVRHLGSFKFLDFMSKASLNIVEHRPFLDRINGGSFVNIPRSDVFINSSMIHCHLYEGGLVIFFELIVHLSLIYLRTTNIFELILHPTTLLKVFISCRHSLTYFFYFIYTII